jgi:anti-sigma regulatory factor (Ser/Thr protein kinase)
LERDSGRPHLLPPGAAPTRTGVAHRALVCSDSGDGFASVLGFAEDAILAGEPVWVGLCAPLGRQLGRALGSQPGLAYVDMTELGRNPGRVIAAMLDFAAGSGGGPLRYLCEPLWAGRSPAERAETARHEALVELALDGLAANVLCVYNSGHLDPADIACAERVHPVVISGGAERASTRYAGPGVVPAECDLRLPPPPAGAARLDYHDDLRAVRAMVTSCAAAAGLAPGRAVDLMLAVSEVAANTLRHTRGDGTLWAWRAGGEVICQVTDTGRIASPLAGRRRPSAIAFGQGGLWVVHQVCDLVEVRTGEAGTTIRMHVRV